MRMTLIALLLVVFLGCNSDKTQNNPQTSSLSSTNRIKQDDELSVSGQNQNPTTINKTQKHWQNAEIAKKFLDQNGIYTNQYKNRLGHEYVSFSSYQDIGSATPLPNNIAYYVKGDSDTVKTLKLVLNVNQPNDAQTAHSVMLNHSQTLYQEVFAKELPPNLKEAITKGKQDQLEIEGCVVTLNREDWPTGKGYSVELVIE